MKIRIDLKDVFYLLAVLPALWAQWPGVWKRMKEIAKGDPIVGPFIDQLEKVGRVVTE